MGVWAFSVLGGGGGVLGFRVFGFCGCLFLGSWGFGVEVFGVSFWGL